MARRRLNFDEVEHIKGTDTLDKALGERVPNTKKIIATKNDGSMTVIDRENFNQPVGDIIDIIPIETDIEKGMSVMEKYLHKEVPHIRKFFQDYNLKPIIDYDEGWIQVKNFPLPEFVVINNQRYEYATETEDILFVLDNFPELPPIGFHVHADSKNKDILEKIFLDHYYEEIKIGSSEYREDVKELSKKGWFWICFHYKNNEWNYDRNDILKHDSLVMYFAFIYAVMRGLKFAT